MRGGKRGVSSISEVRNLYMHLACIGYEPHVGGVVQSGHERFGEDICQSG